MKNLYYMYNLFIAFNISIKIIDMRDFLQNEMQKKQFLLYQYDFYMFLHERFPFLRPFLCPEIKHDESRD